jgi:hypothetical protein
MKVRKSILQDQVTVETYAGQSSVGPAYSAATLVASHADATRRLVVAADGKEAVSELTLTVHPEDAALFTPQSRVTYATRKSLVISAKPATFRGCAIACEVSCT